MTLTVLKNYIDSSGVSTVSDEQSLADGQTVVIFDLPSIASAGFYICGDSADNGRLCDEDYTVDNESQITLAQSYPAGTIVQALLNEPVGSDITDDQLVFDTVNLMKLAGLGIGQLVETKGYYVAGDGGQASYLIEAFATTPDGYGDHLLTNGNVAILQIDATTNIDTFGAISSDPLFSNSDNIEAFQAKLLTVELGLGAYYISRSISLDTGYGIKGKGRRDGSSLIAMTADFDVISLVSNARNWSIVDLNIGSVLASSFAGIKSVATGTGAAEGRIQRVNISALLEYGILAGDTFWNNYIANMRIGSKNGIHILGSNGTSISNLFEDVYIDVTGAVSPLCVKLDATKTNSFINCNFGGTNDVSGGRFVVCTSSNDGTRFISCNFEQMFVADTSDAFNHTDSSIVTYASCTFIGITGNGAASGSSVMRADSDSLIILENSGFAQSTPTTEFNINATGSKFTLISSPKFADQTRIRYQSFGGVTPEYIYDIATDKTTANSITKVNSSQTTPSATLGRSETHSFTGVNDTTPTPVINFTYDAPVSSSDAALMSGVVIAAFSGRNSAGSRSTGYARFDVYFNNDGFAIITRVASMTDGGIGNRTATLDLIQNGDILEITVTPNVPTVSGTLTVEANLLKSKNDIGDIDFAM